MRLHEQGLLRTTWALMRRPVPPSRSKFPPIGWLILILFLGQVLSGILLSFYYQPAPEVAASSVQYVMRDVSWGWLIRGLHHWSTHGIIALGLIQLVRVFYSGAYRGARGSSWCIGLLLLFLAYIFAYTGEMLTWDNDAYWSVDRTVTALESIPVFGTTFALALRGGTEVTAPTLSRAYSTHVLLLPWLTFALLLIHFWLMYVRQARARTEAE